MSTLKLMRLVGAVTIIASAPVVGAIAVYAQSVGQISPAPAQPNGQATPSQKLAPGSTTSDPGATGTGAATTPEAGSPLEKLGEKPSAQSSGSSAGEPPADQRANSGQAPAPGQIVMTSDGQRAGEVTRIKATPDGRVQEIQIKTGGVFGFGARTVAIPAGSFAMSGQNVQLTLTSIDVGKLPPVPPVEG
jgi:PRC-barrel domain